MYDMIVFYGADLWNFGFLDTLSIKEILK